MARGARTGRPYLRLRSQVIAEEQDCAICGLPVDKRLSGRERWGPSLDHSVPLRWGGSNLDRRNGRLAHMACNSARRDGRRVRVRMPGPSENW